MSIKSKNLHKIKFSTNCLHIDSALSIPCMELALSVMLVRSLKLRSKYDFLLLNFFAIITSNTYISSYNFFCLCCGKHIVI